MKNEDAGNTGGQGQDPADPADPAPARPTASRRVVGRPLAWIQAVLRAAGARQVAGKWQCPAHGTRGEHAPSLSLSAGREGQLLIKCHAGCEWCEVLRALRVTRAAL